MKNFLQQGASAREVRGGRTTLLMYRTNAIIKILRNVIIEKPPPPWPPPPPHRAVAVAAAAAAATASRGCGRQQHPNRRSRAAPRQI